VLVSPAHRGRAERLSLPQVDYWIAAGVVAPAGPAALAAPQAHHWSTRSPWPSRVELRGRGVSVREIQAVAAAGAERRSPSGTRCRADRRGRAGAAAQRGHLEVTTSTVPAVPAVPADETAPVAPAVPAGTDRTGPGRSGPRGTGTLVAGGAVIAVVAG